MNDWLKRPLLSEETPARLLLTPAASACGLHLPLSPAVYICCPDLLFLGCPPSGDYKTRWTEGVSWTVRVVWCCFAMENCYGH